MHSITEKHRMLRIQEIGRQAEFIKKNHYNDAARVIGENRLFFREKSGNERLPGVQEARWSAS